MEKENEIVVLKKGDETNEVGSFITLAIEKGLPVETMEKLFALREKAKAEIAKEGFTRAMADFQNDCPIIEKKKIVTGKDGSLRYKYAPLDSIVEQVKKPLSNNGLSYKFDTVDLGAFLNVICVVTHILGHSQVSEFRIPVGVESYMTDAQKYGARVTFAKRYAFCNALGILTGDEDTDDAEDAGKLSLEIIQKICDVKTLEELRIVYKANEGLGKEFAKLVTDKKAELSNK